MNKGNILILGNSGCGKSTLINSIFESDMAETARGVREGVTKKIQVYEKEGMPFSLIDTIGFEPGILRNWNIIREVKKYTKNIAKVDNNAEYVNMIWFCIDGTSPRLFDKTIDNFVGAIKGWKSIPICIVITKSYSAEDTKGNIAVVKSAIERRKIKDRVVGLIPVVAARYVIDDNVSKEPFGLEELIECTNKNLPEGIRAAKRDVESFILERKNFWAHTVIVGAVGSGAAVCAIPIPMPDAVPLTAIESFEVESIAGIYGLKEQFRKAGVVQYIVEAGAIAIVGKSIAQALKAIPGINLATSIINSIVGGSIVATIGKVTQCVCEQVYVGEKTIDDTDWIKKLLDNEFSKGIQSRVKVIGERLKDNDNNNPKEIASIIIEEMFRKK